jgi:hypothetical protein
MPRLYLVRGAVGASSPVRLNGYFQRVLSCRTPANARKMSIHSGMLTMAFVVPPLLIGMAALTYEFQLFCAVGSVHVQLELLQAAAVARSWRLFCFGLQIRLKPAINPYQPLWGGKM